MRWRLRKALPGIEALPDDHANVGSYPNPGDLTPAAVLVPLIERADGWHILLTRRPSHLRTHAGQIAFPGGRMEIGDRSAMDTALRETYEEVGIASDRIEVLGRLATHATVTGYRVIPLVGVVQPATELKPNPREVEEIFDVPLEFALDRANHQRRSGLWRGRRRQYYVIHYHRYEIWGATAAMLVDFARFYHGEQVVNQSETPVG